MQTMSKEREREEGERDEALCIYIHALRVPLLYMLQYGLLFICRDIDVLHEPAGCA